jgi:hypothetical protein
MHHNLHHKRSRLVEDLALLVAATLALLVVLAFLAAAPAA